MLNLKQSFLIALIFQFLAWNTLFAEEIPLKFMGEPFYSPKIAVKWKLVTNSLPLNVRIFNIVPASFSETTISNLMEIGNFSQNDHDWTNYLNNKASKNPLNFRNSGDKHSLYIDPIEGSAELMAPILSTNLAENVPDEARSFNLATNILKELDVPTEQLIRKDDHFKTWFYLGETTIYPKNSEPITRRSSMAVDFRRMLDGIPCTLEDVRIGFGSNEKITQLQVRWHKVKPSKKYPVASLEKIAEWIKAGRARVQSLAGPMDGRSLQPTDIREITIVDISLYYTASTYFDEKNLSDISMSKLYPYAVIQATAEINPDDLETIWLFCPITPGALSDSVKTNSPDGFGISPSNLYEKQMQNQK